MVLIWPGAEQVGYAGFFGVNSQTVGLSSATVSGRDSAFSGGGDITISGDALLPDSGVIGTSADVALLPESDQISIYVVRPGDSLSGIAKMFNVSVNTIVWANDLKRASAIQEGQTLIILPVTGLRHTVVKGETVGSIAKKYKGDVNEILQFNDLSSGATLLAGQVILIPSGEEPVSVSLPSRPGRTAVRGGSGPVYDGYYLQPLVGGVKTQGLHGYNGVDLASRSGNDILASAAGQVIISKNSGWNGGYGKYVVIRHDNKTQTLYSHLSEALASVGQEVAQGEVIGKLGSTGNSTGPHLHFEIRGAKNPF